MEVVIVKSQPSHSEEIARICAEGWEQTVENQGLKVETKKKIVEKWYNPDRVKEDINKGDYAYTALVNGKVAGTIGGKLLGTDSHIWVFYVDPVYRYQGIGRQLLQAFTEEHQNAGAATQFVSVVDTNQYGIPFYESVGFELQETVEKEQFEEIQRTRKYKRTIGK